MTSTIWENTHTLHNALKHLEMNPRKECEVVIQGLKAMVLAPKYWERKNQTKRGKIEKFRNYRL